jgi:predicted DNA-binding WGR domain protein
MRGSQSFRFESSHKYYLLKLEQDLFGNYSLARIWGGRFSRRGNERVERYDSHDEAIKRLEHLAKARERRKGYRRVEKGSDS